MQIDMRISRSFESGPETICMFSELHHYNQKKLANDERFYNVKLSSHFFQRTVTAAVYDSVICNFIAFLEPTEHPAQFQQDIVHAHKSQETTELLCSFFNDRICGCFVRSLHLSIPNILRSLLKNKVYIDPPRMLAKLKQKVENGIRLIDRQMLKRVSGNLLKPCTHNIYRTNIRQQIWCVCRIGLLKIVYGHTWRMRVHKSLVVMLKILIVIDKGKIVNYR